jgi:hypothetical protein
MAAPSSGCGDLLDGGASELHERDNERNETGYATKMMEKAPPLKCRDGFRGVRGQRRLEALVVERCNDDEREGDDTEHQSCDDELC